MKLNEMVQRIKAQQDKMGYTDYINSSPAARMDYMRDITLALIVEAVEMLQELPWKPWKPMSGQPLNIKKAEEESVDVLVFLIDAMLIINPEMDLEEVLTQVLDKIDKRIANKYGKQD